MSASSRFRLPAAAGSTDRVRRPARIRERRRGSLLRDSSFSALSGRAFEVNQTDVAGPTSYRGPRTPMRPPPRPLVERQCVFLSRSKMGGTPRKRQCTELERRIAGSGFGMRHRLHMPPAAQRVSARAKAKIGDSTLRSDANRHHFSTVDSRAGVEELVKGERIRPSSSSRASARRITSKAASHSRRSRYADKQIAAASSAGTTPRCALRSSRKTRAKGWMSSRPSRSTSNPTSSALPTPLRPPRDAVVPGQFPVKKRGNRKCSKAVPDVWTKGRRRLRPQRIGTATPEPARHHPESRQMTRSLDRSRPASRSPERRGPMPSAHSAYEHVRSSRLSIAKTPLTDLEGLAVEKCLGRDPCRADATRNQDLDGRRRAPAQDMNSSAPADSWRSRGSRR